MINMYKFEVCANSVESCVEAQRGGTDRVELCAGIPEGGTTPSYGDIVLARKLLITTKLHVIIRPRGGDFLYSDLEREIMLEDVRMARRLGVDGVVFGVLTSDGDIDMDFMRQLMAESEGMSVTFHRAFDVCNDPFKALEQCKELGINTILTSGQKNSCLAGEDLIRQLVEKAEGKVDILAGAGVNADVIAKMVRSTTLTSFHLSGKITLDSGMKYRKEGVNMGLPSLSEFEVWQTKEENIRAAYNALMEGMK